MLAALASASACDERPPTAPAPARLLVEGTWIGSIADRAAGTGQLTVTASGFDPFGTGTFTLTVANRNATVRGLVIARTANAPTIDLTLSVEDGGAECPVRGAASVARLALSGNRMTGTYDVGFGCPLLAGGSVELTKQ